jgi:signal transduction histidine kinase/CheY-like chemotaxis protein
MENKPPLPENEALRLKALLSYEILDTLPQKELDSITLLASTICQTPISLITLLDEERQWFKSNIGMEVTETSREISFCQYAILNDSLFEVPNALEDPLFKDNPLVTGSPDIRFYAGVPLRNPEGLSLGTLCVIDRVPRTLNEDQRMALTTLAEAVVAQFETRKMNKQLFNEIDTARKAKEQIEIYQDIVQEMTSGLYVYQLDESKGTIDFRLLATNAAATKFTHVEARDRIGVYMSEISPATMKTQMPPLFKKIALGGDSISMDDFQFTSPELLNEYFSFTAFSLPHNTLGIMFDNVTARKIAEQELKEAKEIAEKSVMAKDSFLANMSHEIRTPMNAIIGFTEILSRTPLSHDQNEYVSSVKSAGENLLSIINDILDFSKIESGKIEFEQIPFSLRNELKHVNSLLKIKALEKGIALEVFIDAELPDNLGGDPVRLNQILMNLIGNAIKFTTEGEVTVKVKALEQDGEACSVFFSVKDSGIGIPPEKLDTIFERFTQASNETTRKFGGTGLGLSIAKNLVELQGGSLGVKSTPGKGSEFSFQITYRKATELMGSGSEKFEFTQGDVVKARILLFEDNELNQKLAKNYLSDFGFETEVASNGQIGVEMLKLKEYDLILMDLQMPEMDGYQATRYIRQELKLQTPIMAMTAHSLVGEKDKCIEMGMNEYIPKPFRPQELYGKICKLLQRNEVQPQSRAPRAEKKHAKKGKVQLDYLFELSGGNSEFEKEMLELFLTNVPADMALIGKAIGEKTFDVIKRVSHKLKSSITMVGAHFLLEALDLLEREAEKSINTLEIEKQYELIQAHLALCYPEIRDILAKEYTAKH